MKAAKIIDAEISETENPIPWLCRMRIKSEHIARNAKPGQFIHIKCADGADALLRRPISICRVDRTNGTFEIVFQVKGTGTGYLARKKAGDPINLIGPLGRPFAFAENTSGIAVVGGGIGIFPLLFLLEESKAVHRSAFIGFRDKDSAFLTEEFKNASELLEISSNDGSLGKKGLVTDIFEEFIKQNRDGIKFDAVYTCGPFPMMKKVAKMADKYGIKCQVSLEQRMGCGIGACLVCACRTKKEGGWDYSRVCSDGPVFLSSEVDFGEEG